MEEDMNRVSKRISVLLLAVLFTAACKANVSRNADGSFNVETSISQQELQQAVSASLADPLIRNVTASLQSGYVLVSGDRERLNDKTKTDALSFRLDLGASNGQLTSSISNAQIDGIVVEQNRVDLWNETIANRLSAIGKKNENSSVQSVSITPDAVKITWTVKK